jgi:hypothetical protein
MSDSIYKLFATDTAAEEKGKWVSISGFQFLLARAGGQNTKFVNAYATAMQPYQRIQKMGKFTEDQAREIAIGPFVDHCVLGWRTAVKDDATGEISFTPTIQGKDGPMPFSKDAAKKLLSEIPDLFTTLFDASANVATYAPEDIEASAKNS